MCNLRGNHTYSLFSSHSLASAVLAAVMSAKSGRAQPAPVTSLLEDWLSSVVLNPIYFEFEVGLVKVRPSSLQACHTVPRSWTVSQKSVNYSANELAASASLAASRHFACGGGPSYELCSYAIQLNLQ
jgi:hypothetical protein